MLSVSFSRSYWHKIEPINFPGGELHIDLDNLFEEEEQCVIKVDFRTSGDIIGVLLLTDALRRKSPGIKISLYMPYLPYARQDRYEKDFAFSLKVLCNLINEQNYEQVTILDCHSDVGPALLNRCRNIPVEDLVPSKEILKLAPGTHILAPDQGAHKKCARVAAKLGLPLIQAQKTRDPKTGKVEIDIEYLEERECPPAFLVVDDICDGGATFSLLRECLPLDVDLRLWVTHGIFSKGLKPLTASTPGEDPPYKQIWTANNMSGIIPDLPFISEQLKVYPYVY
jgi:ribose-phosphate pyrophosphokinase